VANQHFGGDPATVMPDLLHATKSNQTGQLSKENRSMGMEQTAQTL
jgi:hypothetical protein